MECTEAPAADVVNLEKEGERKNHVSKAIEVPLV